MLSIRLDETVAGRLAKALSIPVTQVTPELLIERVFPRVCRYSTGATDVQSLAKLHGIELNDISSTRYLGKFEWRRDGRPRIVLGKHRNEICRRFSLAHELGHYAVQAVLEDKSPALFRGMPRSKAAHEEEEHLADAIAAALLMPSNLLAEWDVLQRAAYEDFLRLCHNLKVTRTAMLRRLADYHDLSLALIRLFPEAFDAEHGDVCIDMLLVAHSGVKPEEVSKRSSLARPHKFSGISAAGMSRLMFVEREKPMILDGDFSLRNFSRSFPVVEAVARVT